MENIKYYQTTTDNPQTLRLIDGVMQVFDIEKKWVDSIDWFNKIFFNRLNIFFESENKRWEAFNKLVDQCNLNWNEREN